MTDSIELERLTWPEVKDLMDSGYLTVVFAVASTEQHGPHLPLGTDSIQGHYLAVEAARALGKTLVAPTVRVGMSDHHLDFPGTISVRASTLQAVIFDYCRSLAHHGFKNVIILCSHGGNRDVIRLAAADAARASPGLGVIPICELTRWCPPPAGDRRHVGWHATGAETSRLLALAPDLVKMDEARDWPNPVTPHIPSIGSLLAQVGTRVLNPTGVLGYPSTATKEYGEESLKRTLDSIVRDIKITMEAMETFMR